MTVRTGEVVYWAATGIALLITVLAVASYASNASEGEPVLPIAPLLLALVIWLAGHFCRNALANR